MSKTDGWIGSQVADHEHWGMSIKSTQLVLDYSETLNRSWLKPHILSLAESGMYIPDNVILCAQIITSDRERGGGS